MVFLVGLIGPVAAQSPGCLDYSGYMRPTWGMDTSNQNQTKGGCFTGDYLLLAEGWEGLRIIEMTDQSAPEIVGSLPLSGYCKDVAVSGDIAYVITGGAGWHIIDFSDPLMPVLLETRDSGIDGPTVKTEGSLLFLLLDGGGVKILDISDPTDPVRLSSLYGGDPVDITFDGPLAYVAATSRLFVFDITDPAAPIELGQVYTADRTTGIANSGSTVYVAIDYNGLEAFDVTDPTNPTSLGVTATTGHATDVAANGDLVYVSSANFGVQAFNASDPANLSPLWNMDTYGTSERLVRDGDRLCVIESHGGFHMLDISEPALEAAARKSTPGPLWGAAYHDQHCFVAEGDFGMQVFDVSDPEVPRSVNLYVTPNPVSGILVAEDVAYLAERSNIRILDVSIPTAPAYLGWINSSTPRDLALANGMLFIAAYDELRIFDVTNPEAPQFVGQEVTPDWPNGVDVEGNYAYLAANFAGLQVVDISNAASPLTVGSLELGSYAMDIEVVGHLAFIAASGRGLAIVDVSLPDTPVLVREVVLPNDAIGVRIDESVAYVLCLGGGLVLVDIAPLEDAHVIGCLPSLGATNDIALSDTHVFIADGEGGLAVSAKQCQAPSPVFDPATLPSIIQLESVYPNPFNPRTTISFTLVETGLVSLRIFDLAGRLVRILEDGVLDDGRHMVIWDGRNDAGRLVGSSAYIVRLQAGGIQDKQKILLVR